MSPTTRVVRNRIYIDDRHYDAKVQGGGRFNVVDAAGVLIGSFQVRGRAVEAEDLGVEGADPVELIGQLWVKENLSSVPEPRPIAPPRVAPAPPAPEEVAGPVAPSPVAPQPYPAPAPPARPRPEPSHRQICRVATHNPPDAAALAKAIAYQAWLRAQPGVVSTYLSREPKTGRFVSVTVWSDREKFTAMRYAKPPADASPLVSATVEIGEVLG